MEKAKKLIVVLTLSMAALIVLGFLIATNSLVGTSFDAPIILLENANNDNLIEKVSSTELTKAETNQNPNDEDKKTVTSRSGKHESMAENTKEDTSEAESSQIEVAQEKEAQAEPSVEVTETVEEQTEELVEEEPVEEEPKPTYQGVELEYSARYNVCSSPLSKSKGATYYNGHKETYYSQKVLAGKGLKLLNNNGRHVADDGTVRDGDGYIAVACNYLSKGSEIMTSLGPGKVYDTGGMTGKWIDIYVNW